MADLEFKIEDGELWIEDEESRFEDSIMPHQHLLHRILFVLCRKSSYFEDILHRPTGTPTAHANYLIKI